MNAEGGRMNTTQFLRGLGMKRLLAVGLFVAVVVTVYALGLDDYFTLSKLRAERGDFIRFHDLNPILAPFLFLVAYILVTFFSIPGTVTIMAVAAGVLFDLWFGIVMISLGATLGAMLTFVLGRRLFRSQVQQKFRDQLYMINEGIKREGAFFLFSLRLIPLSPFIVVNLLMALTPMRGWTFFWVTFIGMLPGTVLFVNAGTHLATVRRISDIMSPALILSLLALALFPWFAKGVLMVYRRL
ncbi:TVP38/TMEM64 family protein [Marinimicrobium sp. ABcell2]|uniref:TVP38/TMEM64 family protein n=1 Tax=Marinimicrobium sp. ABcell2 TaxID=3069751 RepID=UPI0027B0D431|nr:TVP38/TMEM64 family protein [Marinimicrobium sp. ABcell2]MDQ2077801.1 TVP38/TMEM64 family protein [Marinimicrobium sp. ABcell2]